MTEKDTSPAATTKVKKTRLTSKQKAPSIVLAPIQLNCLELFAGCGGLGYGFHKEGFNIVACNEYDSQIAETYKANYPNTNVIVGDITIQEVKERAYESFKDKQCDIILGAPPCVAYSMSGHRNSRDPRGQLFKEYVDVVKHMKPKAFVMENVKGILTMLHDKPHLTDEEKQLADNYYSLEEEKLELLAKKKWLSLKGETCDEVETNKESLKNVNAKLKQIDKYILTFRMKVTDIIKETFQELGYRVEMKLLNAANYGVPQKRERVIFIGVMDTITKPITYPEETHNKDGIAGKQKWVSVREAIDDLKENVEDVAGLQHIYTTHCPSFIEKIKNTPNGKSVNPKYTEAFFRCEPDGPSNTVKENHGGVFIHYEKNRVMTPRELARLQSFPDDFKFKGSKSNILVQLGNAVPCGLSHAIAKEVKRLLQ